MHASTYCSASYCSPEREIGLSSAGVDVVCTGPGCLAVELSRGVRVLDLEQAGHGSGGT
jgi:hypothetical protein